MKAKLRKTSVYHLVAVLPQWHGQVHVIQAFVSPCLFCSNRQCVPVVGCVVYDSLPMLQVSTWSLLQLHERLSQLVRVEASDSRSLILVKAKVVPDQSRVVDVDRSHETIVWASILHMIH